MKVLMFGWEFPPHISGGLGTACFGLTQSLIKEKVKVLFVVPRIFGDEKQQHTYLIDAGKITEDKPKQRALKYVKGSARIRHAAVAQKPVTKKQDGMTYIEVLSDLSPYISQQTYRGATRHVAIPAIKEWNYAFSQKHGHPYTIGIESMLKAYSEESDPGVPYLFSGKYGTNLIDEVYRYAAVGKKIAKKYPFDVIHAHDWMTFLAGVSAKRISKKPLIVHVHSTEFDRTGGAVNESVMEIERMGMHEADRVFTVSNWTKQIVMSRYHVPEEKITVVYNGIAPKEKGEDFSFPEIGSHFVTFLGRVTHQKGPAFFVEAAYKVLEEFPEAHFIVAGAGDLLPQIIERVAQLNMSSNFHFTGFIRGSQVDHIWSLTDVYVMPSVSEPFGIAPLEAIQGDVPVILSNQSGVSEVMPHAIKVDFWDIKALAAAICNVLRYESLSNALRQNSKQHIQHLTWDKAASNVNSIYHDLVNNR